MGLAGMGRLVLQALAEDDRFQIVGIADHDPRLVRRLASQFGCSGHDDFRQFVINNSMDCLVVCDGLHRCIEHIRMAIERGVNILRLAPMARSLMEAKELAKAADKASVRYDVLIVPGPSKWVEDLFSAAGDQGQTGPYLLRGILEVRAAEGQAADWMRDKALSGGGVVLHEGYGLVAGLIGRLGMPSRVYCQACWDRPGKASLLLAEDAAMLYCRFPSGCVLDLAMIRYWDWDSHRSDLRLRMYLSDRQIGLDGQAIVTIDRAGHQDRRPLLPFDPLAQIRTDLSGYAASLLQPDDQPYPGTAVTHLQVMAVIQAAYISTQTGCPEDPKSLL